MTKRFKDKWSLYEIQVLFQVNRIETHILAIVCLELYGQYLSHMCHGGTVMQFYTFYVKNQILCVGAPLYHIAFRDLDIFRPN